MEFGRVNGDVEPPGNLFVRGAGDELLQNFHLAQSQFPLGLGFIVEYERPLAVRFSADETLSGCFNR